jgi:hypothetical protein
MLITLLSVLIGGGGSDLLDYVSPSAYWKDKQVAVSVQAMAKELAPAPKADVSKLIDDLNSTDPQTREQSATKLIDAGPAAMPALREAAASPSPQIALSAKRLMARIEEANRPALIRRLMAIRELGELKNKEAMAVLEPLEKSDEPFVADYAREAVDQIDGKPIERRHAASLREDIWLLPAGCRAVGQILGPTNGPIAIEQAIKQSPLPQKADPETMIHTMTGMLIKSAESVGNLRIEALSIGIAGDVGDQSGYVVLIARGQYDSHAVAEFAHKQQMPANVVSGVEVFQPPGAEMALMFPNNQYAVLIASPRGVDLPIEEILTAIRTKQGKLKDVAEIKKLVDQAPADQPIWAVAKVTPAYAKGPVLAPFDTIELRSKRVDKHVQVTITGAGTDPAKAKAISDMVNEGARSAVEEMKRMEEFDPSFKIIEEMMKSVNCQATGGDATVNAKMEMSQAGLLIFPTMFMGRASVHGEVEPVGVPATQPAVK